MSPETKKIVEVVKEVQRLEIAIFAAKFDKNFELLEQVTRDLYRAKYLLERMVIELENQEKDSNPVVWPVIRQ